MNDDAIPSSRRRSIAMKMLCRLPGLFLLSAFATGCQTPPRAVLADLPEYSILKPDRPSPSRTTVVKKIRPRQVRPVARFPREWIPTTKERPWRWVVIHHSATDFGSAKFFDRAHRQRGWDELGYHFVITNGRGGRDGHVEIGSRWGKQKWGAHCGGTPNNAYNNYGIGICLVGKCSKSLPSSGQLRSLKKLLGFLTARYGIKPADVIGHRDAPNAATACPGDALHRYLNNVIRPELSRSRRLAAGSR